MAALADRARPISVSLRRATVLEEIELAETLLWAIRGLSRHGLAGQVRLVSLAYFRKRWNRTKNRKPEPFRTELS